MIVHRFLLGAALLLATHQLQAQEGPPSLDIDATCRSAGSISTGTQKESRDGCLRSERESRDETKRRWGEFSADAKTQCAKQSGLGGSPGYVELLTCLELASGSAPIRSNPSQRTDPGKVLDAPSAK
ncbi:MAG: hypothetical protein K2Y56_22480 [Methylobacterium sp.]|uniref:hypothetical protein n=1 Tax=Methylobacterium sp. TaxID=409 RepID=UPI0025F2DD68|nr:hypothetical protein [Methylobacterium sp.]MBX9934247.1 hypothetical protein [Methylobacterium sp.]